MDNAGRADPTRGVAGINPALRERRTKPTDAVQHLKDLQIVLRIAAMSPGRKFTSWRRGTLPWTRRQMRLRL